MARKEMVPVDKPSVPAEYDGYSDVPYGGYVAQTVVESEPEWLRLRPAHNPDSKLEHGFVNAMTPVRFVCRAILLATWNVYWFIGIAGTILLIVIFLIAR
jgi:hypothetical protein